MVTRKKIHSLVLAVLLSLCAVPFARAGQVVDRIVATVNGRLILQSDWDEALSYEALLNGRSPEQFNDDDRRAVLDRLIDQELLRGQMKSAEFQHATEAEAAARVADARKLYPAAQSDEGWQALLAKFNLTDKDLLAHVQQQIDLMRLVDARLRPSVQIDAKTVESYYRDKFVPQLHESGGGDVPLAEVSAKIRELLTEEKVSELLVSWLHTLRSEGDVRLPTTNLPADGVQSR